MAGSASAKAVFSYDVKIRPALYSLTPSGSVQIGRIDPTKTYTVRMTIGGVAQPPVNGGPPDIARYISVPNMAPGDTITMEQPTGTTLETFTVPSLSMAATAGSPTLTGNAPDGGVSFAFYDSICGQPANDTFPAIPQGGAFAVTYPQPMSPGGLISLTHYPGLGDKVMYESRLPGETPCLDADGYQYPTFPGDTPDPEPFSIRANDLRPSVAPGSRLVLKRGGAILVDHTDPVASSSINKNTAVQPLPGDTLELYRPHTAGAPSTVFTIPAIRSTYDTSNSIVAIDGPAAYMLQFRVASQLSMWQNVRGMINAPAGRTMFNFALSDGIYPAISIANREIYVTDWFSPDARNSYSFGAQPGDLASPALQLKLAAKFRLAKIRSSLSASLTSSELATASIKLTIPAKLKTSASTKPRTLASRKLSVGAGTTKFKLRMTKSAKKLLKKLDNRKYAAQKATLTVTATDPSGNSATTIKTTKLVRK